MALGAAEVASPAADDAAEATDGAALFAADVAWDAPPSTWVQALMPSVIVPASRARPIVRAVVFIWVFLSVRPSRGGPGLRVKWSVGEVDADGALIPGEVEGASHVDGLELLVLRQLERHVPARGVTLVQGGRIHRRTVIGEQ